MTQVGAPAFGEASDVASVTRFIAQGDRGGYGDHRWQQAGPFVEAVYSEFGRCDVFVNNAGVSPRYDPIADVTEAMFDSVVNVCFKGPFRLAVLFGDRMCAAGGGSIINVSSTDEVRGGAGREHRLRPGLPLT